MESIVGDDLELWGPTYFRYDYKLGFRQDGEIVGVIGLSTAGDNNLIASKFLVSPLYRKQGVGTAILRHCIDISEREQKRLVLYVDKNEPTTDELLRFYKKRGFVEASLSQAQQWCIALDEEFDHLLYFYKVSKEDY